MHNEKHLRHFEGFLEWKSPKTRRQISTKLGKKTTGLNRDYDKVAGQRDDYKTSLDTVNAKLKDFEGVDVEDLKGQMRLFREI